MHKKIALVLVLICVLGVVGCKDQPVKHEGNMKTYYALPDGTWQAEGHTYQYRLEISGRMPNAAVDSTFVYLSNLENITFQQAWNAAGLSSDSAAYFAAEDAVLVEMRTD